MMRAWMLLGLTLFAVSGCKKEQPAAPPPAAQAVAAPAQAPVPPGMEAENPAEKEGQP